MNQTTAQLVKRAAAASTATLALILTCSGGTAIAAETQTAASTAPATFETSAASNLALGSSPWGNVFPGIPDIPKPDIPSPSDVFGAAEDAAGAVRDGVDAVGGGLDDVWNEHTRGCAGNGITGGLAGAQAGPGWAGIGAAAGCLGGWD